MKSFFVPAGSTMLLALSLTPELTNMLGILVAAICVGAVNLYMAHTQRLVQMRAIDQVDKKIDKIIPVVEKIDGHVNSEKTKAEGEIAAKEIEIALQREMIVELKAAAALLAQARATSDISNAIVAAATIPAAASPVPVLASIDTNTKETAQKTDAVVQVLKENQ